MFVLGRIDQRFDDHRPGSLESLGQGVMHLCDRTHSASQARQNNGSVADRRQARGACHSTESPGVLVYRVISCKWRSTSTTKTTASPRRTAVAISPTIIKNPPSPVTQTTCRSG